MRGKSLRTALLSAVALAAMAGFSAAFAGPVVIFNSLGEAPVIHPEGITEFAGGMAAASFTTSGILGNIQSLTLDLNCSGQEEPGKCAAGTYSNVQQVKYLSGATANSNQLTLNSVSGITVGSFLQGGGPNGIAGGTTYVTAINTATKTLTLSKALTSTQAADLNNNTAGGGRAVVFLPQGSFTVSLFASTTTGIPGGGASSTSIPTGTALKSFTVYDAALYVQNSTITNADPAYVPYKFTLPFGYLDLSKNTTYWIELSNLSPTDPTNTDVGWEFLKDTNQASNVGVKNEYRYVKNYTCGTSPATHPCSQINGGSTDTVAFGAFGMEVTEIPEPGTLSLLGTFLLGCGLTIRRRSSTARH